MVFIQCFLRDVMTQSMITDDQSLNVTSIKKKKETVSHFLAYHFFLRIVRSRVMGKIFISILINTRNDQFIDFILFHFVISLVDHSCFNDTTNIRNIPPDIPV